MPERKDSNAWRRARDKVRRRFEPCWLCGREIDYDLKFPHPLSFTADHVVPIAKGGMELDPDNLRAAHLRCNQRKGDKLVPIKPKVIELNTSRKW